ncbi:MAG: Ubiquitin-conjugating enzyme E2 G2 [Marteilia pararefringens]
MAARTVLQMRNAVNRLRRESILLNGNSSSPDSGSNKSERESHVAEGIIANFSSADDLFEWDAYIQGPENSHFEFGIFHAKLTFPKDYPMSPPKMKFIHPKLFHPNIYKDGSVCISILHPAGEDPMGYELPQERWTPAHSIEKILLSVMSLLAEPNAQSPANVDAAKMFRDDLEQFRKIAQASVRESLDLD